MTQKVTINWVHDEYHEPGRMWGNGIVCAELYVDGTMAYVELANRHKNFVIEEHEFIARAMQAIGVEIEFTNEMV